MGIAMFAQAGIGPQFVGANRAALFNLPGNDREQRGLFHVRHWRRIQIAVPLNSAEHDGLTGTPGSVPALVASAYVGLIDLYMTAKRVIAIDFAHVLADFMTDAPRRFVGHAQLALQFLGRHTMPGRGEQVHGVEPLLQGRAGLLERRADHRVNMVSAIAGIGGELFQATPLADNTAPLTSKLAAEADFEQVLQARIVIGKAAEKVCNRELLSHVSLHTLNMGIRYTYVKGIIA